MISPWSPLFLLLLLLLVLLSSAQLTCPKEKNVGGICYTRKEDGVDTSKYGCKENCTYQKKHHDHHDHHGHHGHHGHHDLFCFKVGDLPVSHCEGEGVPGEQCNRNCTVAGDLTCIFNFTLKDTFSDHEGAMADGRNRSIVAYNGLLPGPPIVVCHRDKVVH